MLLQVVMSLPDDIRPGPDLYGLPWEAVIFTATLGLITFLLFTCRFIQAVSDQLPEKEVQKSWHPESYQLH